MIAIIPIFLQNNETLWHSSEGQSLLRKFLQAVLDARLPREVIVSTNDASVLALAKSVGIDSCLIKTDPPDGSSPLLPPGTDSSLQFLDRTGKINSENCLVLNFRNPNITSCLIDKAIERFKHSHAPAMMSIKKTIDHPCQLNAYYKISDVGIIHFIDDDASPAPYLQALWHDIQHHDNESSRQQKMLGFFHNQRLDNLRLTKPFVFDWESRGVDKKHGTGIYHRVYDGVRISYHPLEKIADLPEKTVGPLWLYDGQRTARVLFQIEDCDKLSAEAKKISQEFRLAGATFSHNPISLLMYRNTRKGNCLLFLVSDRPTTNHSILRIVPTYKSGPDQSQALEYEIDDLSTPISFEFKEGDVCGILYLLLQMSQEGSYDFMEPFPADEKLWTNSIHKVNVKTGKKISGRQDFPDVFEPDGALCILKKNLTASLDKEIASGNVEGFVVDQAGSFQIDSEFDLLRYRAILRANNSI